LNTFEIIYTLLKNASHYHKITQEKLDKATFLYNSAPYSSEAIFELVIARNNHLIASNLLLLAQNYIPLSTALRSFVILELRKLLSIEADQSPDPLTALNDIELLQIYARLLKHNIRPSHIGRMVELSTDGELQDFIIWVTEVAKRVRQAIRDGLDDDDFDDNKA